MSIDEPTTQQLKIVQSERESAERDAARDAATPDGEQAHDRRADKAAYLKDKLAEQEDAQRS